ncbi:hypothetical protein V6N11_012232 [Hibiscus sabdariffa]|uniref:Uncharacterized protein n=1 Tax=Hibiscus sabdariffa TaxID=183260 RepID=A0ABR2QAI4_9ROSI
MLLHQGTSQPQPHPLSANMVADRMAKLARSSYGSSLLDVGFATRVFSMPPDAVVNLVHDDVSSVPDTV